MTENSAGVIIEERKHNDMIAHLQMIQNVISRMSTTSAIFKGFTATIVTGIFAISLKDVSELTLILTIFPIICFFLMDVYYFRLEKKYRVLYEKIRKGERYPDFSMNASCNPTELIDAKATWGKCILSPCIFGFYVTALTISIIIIIFKYVGEFL